MVRPAERLPMQDPAPDTKAAATTTQLVGPTAPAAVLSTASDLYASPSEALKAVRDDYLYWTGKLSDTSLQLSYAVIAANWAAFGSVNGILASFWSKLSVLLVIVALGVSVVGAKLVGESLRDRIQYAEADLSRWSAEFKENACKRSSWPFTQKIDRLGRILRETRTWLPLVAGLLFVIGLMTR
jgi:hypothetical protein